MKSVPVRGAMMPEWVLYLKTSAHVAHYTIVTTVRSLLSWPGFHYLVSRWLYCYSILQCARIGTMNPTHTTPHQPLPVCISMIRSKERQDRGPTTTSPRGVSYEKKYMHLPWMTLSWMPAFTVNYSWAKVQSTNITHSDGHPVTTINWPMWSGW